MLTRSIRENGTLYPAAQTFLQGVPEAYCYMHARAPRNPLAIYNVSLNQLQADFEAVLDAYESTRAAFKRAMLVGSQSADMSFNDLLTAQRQLLYSLQAHIDDCFSIISSLVDMSSSSEKQKTILYTEQFLKSVGVPGLSSFTSAISDYRTKYIGPLVNGIKHKQSRLRPVAFTAGTQARIGYFLEQADEQGVLGPAASVHEAGNTAFSFPKDLSWNVYHLYSISNALVTTLEAILSAKHGCVVVPQKCTKYDGRWTRVLSRISELEPLVFPDEVYKPYPLVAVKSEEEDDVKLTVMYPTTVMPLDFPAEAQIHSQFMGDGVTRTFRLPYLARSRYGSVR